MANLIARNNRRPRFSAWAEMGKGSLYKNIHLFWRSKNKCIHTNTYMENTHKYMLVHKNTSIQTSTHTKVNMSTHCYVLDLKSSKGSQVDSLVPNQWHYFQKLSSQRWDIWRKQVPGLSPGNTILSLATFCWWFSNCPLLDVPFLDAQTYPRPTAMGPANHGPKPLA